MKTATGEASPPPHLGGEGLAGDRGGDVQSTGQGPGHARVQEGTQPRHVERVRRDLQGGIPRGLPVDPNGVGEVQSDRSDTAYRGEVSGTVSHPKVRLQSLIGVGEIEVETSVRAASGSQGRGPGGRPDGSAQGPGGTQLTTQLPAQSRVAEEIGEGVEPEAFCREREARCLGAVEPSFEIDRTRPGNELPRRDAEPVGQVDADRRNQLPLISVQTRFSSAPRGGSVRVFPGRSRGGPRLPARDRAEPRLRRRARSCRRWLTPRSARGPARRGPKRRRR